MIELVLAVIGQCHVANWVNEYQYQIRCNSKEVHLTYAQEGNPTPQQCVFYGQAEIAKWAEGNPNWRIEKWKCGTVKQGAKTI